MLLAVMLQGENENDMLWSAWNEYIEAEVMINIKSNTELNSNSRTTGLQCEIANRIRIQDG